MTVELSSALSGHTATLELLESWCERGWLRDLDRALAQFFIELDPAASPLLILAAALASHQLGQGHVCWIFKQLCSIRPDTVTAARAKTQR